MINKTKNIAISIMNLINIDIRCYHLLSPFHAVLSASHGLCHLIQQYCDINTIIILILQLRKLSFSEASYLAQELMNSKWY